MLLTDFEAQGITPDIALETSSKEILKQFARNGLGAAFMPDMAAEEEISSGRLVRLNWGGNAFPVFSQVFVHKDKRVSFAISELVELIKNNE